MANTNFCSEAKEAAHLRESKFARILSSALLHLYISTRVGVAEAEVDIIKLIFETHNPTQV